MTARVHASCVAAVLLTAMVVAQEEERVPSGAERPLPDEQAFFAATRDNLARSEREQRFFAYKERRTELRTNPFGRLGTGPTRVYDVTPLPEGGFARRLLERDGMPVSNAKAERFDPRNRGGRRSGRSQLDDAVATLEFTVDRRETAGGRSLIVVRFTPRADAKPETRAGRLARSFAGDIWVDEALHEIVHVEATAIDDIAYGYGVVARLNEGTRVRVVRRQIEPTLWLPVSLRFNGQGRALLFRKLTLDYAVDWFDYRRTSPDAQRPSD